MNHRRTPWSVTAYHLDKPAHSFSQGSLRFAGNFTTRDLSGSVLAEKFEETIPAPGLYLLIGGPGPHDHVNPIIVNVEPVRQTRVKIVSPC